MSAAEGYGDPWWRHAVVYEIYPRSFADGDGDGEGDLRGIIDRMAHLRDLGVDAVWMAPWYPSPLADGGYDITDYRDIHPRLGTLADADELLATAHRHGLRVIVDLVANHTSSRHPWFVAALAAGPDSKERDRYLFRDGRGDAGELPPNNWISAFGDSAWTRVVEPDGTPGQWYLHTFAPEQPDLDWEDEEVLAEFDAILRFWLDRGVDGFRVDAVPAMGKEPGLPDADYGGHAGFASSDWRGVPHWDTDGVHDVLRRWRRVVDDHPGDHVFVAEAVVAGPDRLARYLRPDELHTAFNFDYVHARWDAHELRTVVTETLETLEEVGAPATWAMSSHDEVRHLTRFGQDVGAGLMGHTAHDVQADLQLGERRARAAILLTLALPGGAYLYQGEELGLAEVVDLPDAVLQDPIFHRSGGTIRGRDGCRVPLPWSGGAPPYGFSPGEGTTWLPQPTDWADRTVEAQLDDDESMLWLYKNALRLRREIPGLRTEPLTWLPSAEGVLHFARGPGFRCLVNLTDGPVSLDERAVLRSAGALADAGVPPDTAVWTTEG